MQYGTYATPRADLGVAMWEYMTGNVQFIGTRALPLLPVPRVASTISVLTRETILRTGDVKRAAGGGYNRDEIQGEDKSYACEEYGKEKLIDDTQRELYASDFDLGAATSQIAAFQLLLAQEIRVATAVFNTTTWTGATLYTDRSATPWDTSTTDIISHVMDAKEKVRDLTGMVPNTLIIGQAGWNSLKMNDDLVGRVAYTARADDQAMENAIAPLLGLQQILVGRAKYNTADEGATLSLSDVWNHDYAMVCVTSGGSLASPGIGYCPIWTQDSPSNVTVDQYRAEDRRSDVYRVRHYVDELIADASFGHLLKID